MYLVILLYALFAVVFSLSKQALIYSEPFFFIGSRMVVFGLLLLIIQLLWNKKEFKFISNNVGLLLLFGFVAIYLTNIAEIWAIKTMVSSKVCLLYSLSPFLSAFIAYLMLREKLSRKKWVGFIIGFCGLLPIIFAEQETNITTFSHPEFVMLVAIISSVYGWVLLKKLVSEYNYSTLIINGVGMVFGGVLAIFHSYLSGEIWDPIPVNNILEFTKSVFLISIISNFICYNLYGYLLKQFSVTFMSFAGLTTPLFASFFGWLFLQETVDYTFFLSLTIFLFGLVIFYLEEIKLRHIKF